MHRKIAVIGINASGNPNVWIADLQMTQRQFDAGEHLDLAVRQAAENDFQGKLAVDVADELPSLVDRMRQCGLIEDGDPPCYFRCEACGSLATAPTSDVKAVGHPMCPDCTDREMSEVTRQEYEAFKAEQIDELGDASSASDATKPQMKRFEALLTRTMTRRYRLEVEAADEHEARAAALSRVSDVNSYEGTESEPEYGIEDVQERHDPN